jgi:hypothetical protein
MNTKTVLLTLGIVAAVGAAGYFGYKYVKAKAANPVKGGTAPAPGTSATGSNANSTNWLSTIGSLFGDLGHLSTGNSTSPTNNTTTTSPVTTDNSGTSWDNIINQFA